MPQVQQPAPRERKHEQFPLPLFALTILTTLTGLLAVLRFIAPHVWTEQFLSPFWKGAVAFLLISLVNCFAEYFFHRYVLHTPAISVLRRLYRQHTLRHALLQTARKPCLEGRGILFIQDKFPILEPANGRASLFRWYTPAVFAVVLSLLFSLLEWLFPSFPWFFAGFSAVAVSVSLYGMVHTLDHWPLEKWEPLIEHSRWGRFWRWAYAFRLQHCAVPDCNESVSGFFGLPLGDWVFGTCVFPRIIYADSEEWAPDTFRSPQPRGFIRWLDVWVDGVVQRRHALAALELASKTDAVPLPEPAVARRAFSRGEEIANWVTHGIGLALSVFGFTLLVALSSLRGDVWHVVSFTVFGLTLMALYGASTVYHAQRGGKLKALFLKLDHAAIFLLIAGTYTPFLLTNLRGPWGWSLFGIIWGLCGAGAVFKLIFGARHQLASTLAYLFLGWLMVVAFRPLAANVPPGALWLLLAGGLCYTVGVLFFQWHRLRYHHAVWHTFVLGGSTCHFLAVILFLLPRSA